MPERYYQQENKGSVVKKIVGWTIVGLAGVVGVLTFIEIGGFSGLGVPTTPNAPLLQAA